MSFWAQQIRIGSSAVTSLLPHFNTSIRIKINSIARRLNSSRVISISRVTFTTITSLQRNQIKQRCCYEKYLLWTCYAAESGLLFFNNIWLSEWSKKSSLIGTPESASSWINRGGLGKPTPHSHLLQACWETLYISAISCCDRSARNAINFFLIFTTLSKTICCFYTHYTTIFSFYQYCSITFFYCPKIEKAASVKRQPAAIMQMRGCN